jgi:hypothetical protein
MELLFSGTPKEQNTKSKFVQETYNFLDNSNWEIAHEVRSILQSWANDFKPDKDFLSSFKTEEHFHSHFFELFIWKYCTALGNSVEKTDRNCNTTVPDFLCSAWPKSTIFLFGLSFGLLWAGFGGKIAGLTG